MTRQPGGPPSNGEDPFLGALIAERYRLLEKIGEGGMGAVYRGVHETLRKPVAVKLLLRGGRADRESVTRFEREAIASANLKHPNITEATDSGQTKDGTLFLVMEYIQGLSLRQILARDGRLPPARALHLLRQIGAALSFAHGLDVVHRDLKPENVVVFDRGDERDVVKVIDFGIARMRSSFGGGPTALTALGSVFGTADYMAPEQAMGQAVDARADQYAVGVMAFELLTGRPPYQADNLASLIYMHVGAPIPRVTERAPDLPPAVDGVIATMMGKLPDERFPTLAEAIAALAGALDRTAPASLHSFPPMSSRGRPLATLLPPVQAALPGAAPRSTRPIALLAAIGLALAVIVLLVIFLSRAGSAAPSSAVSRALTPWNDRRYSDAGLALRSLLSTYPGAEEDAALTHALAGSVRDPEAEKQLDDLLGSTPLGRSAAMGAALADMAVRGTPPERDASLRLLHDRHAQLVPEARARVELRDAEDCPALQDAATALGALGTSPAQGDLDALRNDCKRLLRKGKLCDDCSGGAAGGPLGGPGGGPDHGKAKGKSKGKGKGKD